MTEDTIVAPKIRPIEILAAMKDAGELDRDGFIFTANEDGSPVAKESATGQFWVCTGDAEEDVTEATEWLAWDS